MYYSHYEKDSNNVIIYQKELKSHLYEVAASTREITVGMQQFTTIQPWFIDLAYLIGLSHDFGKYTHYFQEYLINNVNTGPLKNHSLFSALWGIWVVCNQEKWDYNIKKRAFLLTFACILNHHGEIQNINLWLLDLFNYFQPDICDYMDTRRKQAYDALFTKQLPDVLKISSFIDNQLKDSHLNLPSVSSLDTFLQSVPDSDFFNLLSSAINQYETLNTKQTCGQFNQELYLLFSVLIDTDKRDAANISKDNERPYIPEDLVTNFITSTKFPDSDQILGNIRKSLFQDLDSEVKQINLNKKIYTLTAPTGAGKTLSVLNFAFKLRQRIYTDKKYLPRIVYALPFTSIIDQNYNTIFKVLSQLTNFTNNQSAFLLKHHHLAEIEYKTEKEDNLPVEKALMLVESWEAEIIVTTFIQIFNTICGNKNRFLKKYYKLFGSIIILDEIQNINIEYWELINKQLLMLSEWAQCTIILMSATQPLIFQPHQSVELVKSFEKYFKSVNRTIFKINLIPQKLNDFYILFKKQLEANKSYAIIVNTIRTSIDLHKLLENDKTIYHKIFYLSTNIIPKHRAERIQEICKFLEVRKPIILVCTQVIEAGVDFDFDVIFRDIAPIDSLVQSAGRANRNGNDDKGIVNIIKLVNEQDKVMAKWIYGQGHLTVAEKLLCDVNEIYEPDFYHLVKNSYKQLANLIDQNLGIQIFKDWWLSSKYEALEKFNLISQHGFYRDVFIPIDEYSKKIWDQYLKLIIQEPDVIKKRKNHLLIKKSIRDYTLSISENQCKIHFWDYCRNNTFHLGYINPDFLQDYYNINTGFKRFDEQETMIF
ncbi:MAG TPA: CRISPR-associated helicase Cas3' [bacterium]|nr:CRISPR-associated helicase Cas3' [bacterium]HPN43934.1 CRISPR-associated helicase Cas3' [bacterium]